MHAVRVFLLAAICCVISLTASALGSFHSFEIREVYSNYDGTLQFIELYTGADGMQNLSGTSISAISTVGSASTTNTYPITASLPQPSEKGSRVLLATAGFATLTTPSIPVTPDYTIPAHFFDPFADQVVFNYDFGAGHIDTLTIAAPWFIPRDGFRSLHFDHPIMTMPPSFSIGLNSPRNFSGQSGLAFVPSTTGDYNLNGVVDAADYLVWRERNGQTASDGDSHADGNKDNQTNNLDYEYWRARFGNSVYTSGAAATSSVPEPAAFALLAFAAAFYAAFRRCPDR